MAQSKDTKHWRANIKVELFPVNTYGDVLSGTDQNRLGYSIELPEMSLVQIAQRLERLKEPN